jgi:hypothetical protein
MFGSIGYLVGGVVAIGGGVFAARFVSNKKQKVGEFRNIPVITACLEPSFQDRNNSAAENLKDAKDQLEAVENKKRKLEEEYKKNLDELVDEIKAAQDLVDIHETAADNVKALHDAIHDAVATYSDAKVKTHATGSKRKRA